MKIPISKKYIKNTQKSKNNKKKGGDSSQYCIYDYETKRYQGLCPGVIYFDEIKDSLVKDPDAVYMIFGHGCDLKDEFIEIPPKCKFITRVACGLTMSDIGELGKRGVLGESFFDDFSLNKLETPLSIENLSKYERLLSITDEAIQNHNLLGLKTKKNPDNFLKYPLTWRIHNEKDTFVNSKNWCFIQAGLPAGLRKLGISTPLIPEHPIAIQKYTWRSYALLHFEGSLFPTCQQVNIVLNKNFSIIELDGYDYYTVKLTEIIKNTFSIDYGTIVKHLVGTFINGVCRALCKGPETGEDIYGEIDDFVKVARVKSQRANSQTIYEIDSQFPKEYILTPELKSKLQQLENHE